MRRRLGSESAFQTAFGAVSGVGSMCDQMVTCFACGVKRYFLQPRRRPGTLMRPVLPGRKVAKPGAPKRRGPISSELEILVGRHGRRLIRLLEGILGDRGDAEDASQETWWALWRARPVFESDESCWSYLRRTAVRKAVDRQRARNGRVRLQTTTDPEPAVQERPGPEVDLSAVPARQRACLLLYFWEGLSVQEIASELSVPEGTVKSWMFHGRRTLAAALRPRRRLP